MIVNVLFVGRQVQSEQVGFAMLIEFNIQVVAYQPPVNGNRSRVEVAVSLLTDLGSTNMKSLVAFILYFVILHVSILFKGYFRNNIGETGLFADSVIKLNDL